MFMLGEGFRDSIEAAINGVVGTVLTVVLQSVLYATGAPNIYALYYVLILLIADIADMIVLTQKSLKSFGYLIGRILGTLYGIEIVAAAGFSTLSLWISLFLCIAVFVFKIWWLVEE
ncbi:hypothetical protein [Thermococcus sp. GR4]|uniref:hypothetical protein n=1 Tax=Thermococcus sp. GR4 TaxID=1638254 RepID=UPI00142F969F|nr:hypothetical protein [Thermococcus sp. GR4]NJE79575.1 hypothetical protein [Thermococcus sp. GR4]